MQKEIRLLEVSYIEAYNGRLVKKLSSLKCN